MFSFHRFNKYLWASLLATLLFLMIGLSGVLAGPPAQTGTDPTPTPTPYPPPPPSFADPLGYVVVYQLNVRSGPGLFYPVISSLPYGASRSLLGRNSEASWLQINLPDGRPGWVMARYISANVPIYTLPITDGPPPPPVDKPLGVVLVYRLNVRSGPGFGYEILNQLSGGQQVRLQGRNSAGDWLKIEWGGYPAYGPGGTIPVYLGWVSARYLRSFTPIYDLPVVQ